MNLAGDGQSLAAADTNITAMIKCLQSLKADTSSLPTAVENLRQEILTLQESVEAKEEEVHIARRRVENLRRPDRDVSFYQGWFPIDRPLRHHSVPILIGFTILFFTLFIGFILSAMGIQFGFDASILLNSPAGNFMKQLTPAFWVTVVLLVTVTTVALNIIRAK
jgi:hypothetical protein